MNCAGSNKRYIARSLRAHLMVRISGGHSPPFFVHVSFNGAAHIPSQTSMPQDPAPHWAPTTGILSRSCRGPGGQYSRFEVKRSMKKRIGVNDCKVEPDTKVKLGKWPTRVEPLYDSDKDYEEKLAASKKRLSEQQQLLYAHNRYALLLIFQAMDAAGKDGAIRHVMSGVNPQGCQVYSFKHPSAQELDHDFLWRTHLALPERGRIGIFNRSYYEEVLIVKVQPQILQAQGLPKSVLADKHFWEGRYRSIVESESHLYRNGTRILKFFLHLSREEQRQRFLARIDDPDKNWKFSSADIEQRQSWDDYMKAYETCLSATSTHDAPWHIVPADDKKNARLIISKTIVDALGALKLSYPKVSEKQRADLQAIRRRLTAEAKQ